MHSQIKALILKVAAHGQPQLLHLGLLSLILAVQETDKPFLILQKILIPTIKELPLLKFPAKFIHTHLKLFKDNNPVSKPMLQFLIQLVLSPVLLIVTGVRCHLKMMVEQLLRIHLHQEEISTY